MSLTLYRKYRPQFFADLAGQEHVKLILQNEIKAEKITHAYLFCGPRGTGKTTTARLLAKAINCQNQKDGGEQATGEPCDRCDSCREIAEGRSLDLIEIDAASNRGINEIRELREQVRFTPSKNRYKVFIIDEVHMLTPEAFNALLKTLEEPPKHAIFILATTEIHKVPETIISRCQRFDFAKIPVKDLTERLKKISSEEGIKVADKILENIARRSDGCSRDAEVILGQILSLSESAISGGKKEITEEEVNLVIPRSNWEAVAAMADYLAEKNGAKAIISINQLIGEGADIRRFANDLVEFLRKLMLVKVIGDTKEFYLDLNAESGKVSSLAAKFDLKRLIDIIRALVEQMKEMEYGDIPQLSLELAVAEICLNDEGGNDSELKGGDSAGKKDTPPIKSKIAPLSPSAAVKTKTEEQSEREKILSEETESPDLSEQTETIEVAVENISPTGGHADAAPILFEEIKNKWDEVLKNINQINYSLFALLKMGVPVSLENSTLHFGFPFKFHQEKLKERKNKQIFEEVLEKVFQQKIRVESKIVGQEFLNDFNRRDNDAAMSDGYSGGQAGQEGNVLDKILQTFGGKVVE